MRNSLKSICRKMNIIIFSYLRYNVLEFMYWNLINIRMQKIKNIVELRLI